MVNQVVRLKEFPQGLPDPARDFEVSTVPEPPEDLGENEIIVSLMSLSMDPFLRGRMTGHDTYVPGFKRGAPIEGFGVGKVLKSNNKQYKVNDYVSGMFPWQLRFVLNPHGSSFCRRIEKDNDEDPETVSSNLTHWIRSMKVATKLPGVTQFMNWVARKSDNGLETPGVIGNSVPLTYHTSILGMPGLTAWLGLMKVCQPKAGETLFVSAASGAVGSLVCQIGKMKGLKVIGSAGTDAKCNYLKSELNVDEVINYKTCGSILEALKKAAPNGIDCYFDNVGGETLDAVLAVANKGARIAICGAISQYNVQSLDEMYATKNTIQILTKQMKVQGFIVDSLMKEFGMFEALLDLCEGIATKKIKYTEDIVKGQIDEAPHCFVRMLKGDNFGKQQFVLTQ